MGDGDDRLTEEIGAGERHGQSMDVLLQLTLPMVLILAFLVVTEVQTLSDQIRRLKKDIQNTATGRLSEERDTTLMELRLQLLYQATDQVAQAEEEALALREYGLLAPGVDDIVTGQVDERFVATSQKLFELLNGEERREQAERRLRAAVEERFAELVARELGEFEADARASVLSIPAVHRMLYETKLQGHLERFLAMGTGVQLELMLDWLEDPTVGLTLRQQSLSLWRKLQQRLTGADTEAVPFEDFVNLRAVKLVEALDTLGAPVLDRAKQEAGL